MIDLNYLSKVVSHALRHEPLLYELEPDEYGWVSIRDLMAALRGQKPEWQNLTEAHLKQMIERASKQRHEMCDGKIRALYGHSYLGQLLKPPAIPPKILYHGTAPKTAIAISQEGLKPMGRQHVHLSLCYEKAFKVGKRKAKNPVVLKIQAFEAYQNNVEFYKGNDTIWLAKYIPPQYIEQFEADRPANHP